MHSFSTDQPRRHERYILIGVASAGAYLGGIAVFGPVAGLSIGAVSSVLYLGFTRWLWKWDVLHRYGLVSIPDLNGTWTGYLYTSRDHDDIPAEQIVTDGTQYDGLTKQETTITIKQRWDKISVTLEGPESPSRSEAATILVNEKAWPTLTYNYWNEGSMTNDALDPHYGTAVLEYDADADTLEGKYYNRPDHRATHGVLELSRTG